MQIKQTAELHELPKYWQSKIGNLRKECADTRVKNRELREEVERLNAELDAVRGGK
ncbi:hypothetical protein [Mycobacterium sp. D16R24]|uniref:hypothetical protein n=1 Tax=Mycobacterium sp. D16R24 TaxID=1855656 RepID=UPI00158FDE7B|nr:hypothetical protein [Mycobacterium sp. D16R24]